MDRGIFPASPSCLVCQWRTVDEVDEEHGKRRWQRCDHCGAERKQRWQRMAKAWLTVWNTTYAVGEADSE